jgi:type I restriction enzyme S subunit
MNLTNPRMITSVKLGEVCRFKGGSGFREALQGSKSGQYPFIKVSDMELLCNRKYIVDANNWIDKKTLVRESITIFPVHSVVFAKVGAALLLNRRRILTRETAIDNNMMGAIPEKIEPDFLFYVLLNIDFSNFVQSGAVPSINQAQISNIETILPCSAEQTQIATILSTIDRAIEQTEALIAKQQRIKTGLMQDLLTKGIDENGNIRSEETHEFKDSPLGRIPVEWDCKDIITIAYVTKLAGFEFTNYFNYSIGGEIIALRALNIKNEKLDLTDIQTIPKKVSDILPRSKINRNDILITYIGAYIGDVLRIEDNEKFHLAPNIAKIVSKDGVYPQFLEIALRTHYLQRQIKNLTATTATPSLTMTQIRSLLVAIPRNQSEQKVITEHISRITKVIDENASRLAKLKLQKTGLMQDLLTGKVRVIDLLNQKTAAN